MLRRMWILLRTNREKLNLKPMDNDLWEEDKVLAARSLFRRRILLVLPLRTRKQVAREVLTQLLVASEVECLFLVVWTEKKISLVADPREISLASVREWIEMEKYKVDFNLKVEDEATKKI